MKRCRCKYIKILCKFRNRYLKSLGSLLSASLSSNFNSKPRKKHLSTTDEKEYIRILYFYNYIYITLYFYNSIFMYIYISIYLYLCISIFMYIYIYLYLCISIYIYIYVYLYLYLCNYINI